MGKIDLTTLEKMVHSRAIETVIIAGIDRQGRFFGKRCTAEFFLTTAINGINICSLNLEWDIELSIGQNSKHQHWDRTLSDIKLIPDLATLRIYPWFEKTALVIADLSDQAGTPIPFAPRNILKQQVAKVQSLGYEVQAAFELEFYLFKETIHSASEKNYRNLNPTTRTVAESMYLSSCDEWFLSKVRRYLGQAGVEVECTKVERGLSQMELNLQYAEALEMADRTAIYKNGLKEMAYLDQLMVTFMARYKDEEPASSAHIHLSLWDEKKRNVLWDEHAEYQMSAVGKNFLAGMLRLTPDLMCFYAPYINSYKRYGSTVGAPSHQSWGLDNRHLAYRVIGGPEAFRIENRLPGADVNPYLALAACIAAGLYGIEHRLDLLEPPLLIKEPSDRKLIKLPSSLMEAVQDLEKSVVARDLFGNEVIEQYAAAIRDEIDGFMMAVTDWERRRYFEQI